MSVWPNKFGDREWRVNARKGIQSELRKGQPICSDGVVHDLWRVKVEKWCPRNRVESLEEEHDSHITVNEALRGTVRIIGILLG